MKTKILLATTVLVVTSLAIAASLDKVTIQWKPKANTVAKYKFTGKAKIDAGGQLMDIEISADVTRTVKDVKSDGNIVIEEKQDGVNVMVSGTSLGDQPATTSTTTYKPSGEVVERKSDAPPEAQMPRIEQATNFTFPGKDLEENETWVTKTPADTNKGTFSTESTFTYLGKETINGIECYKIKSDFRETDAPTNLTGTATAWIRVETGEPVKSTMNVKNAPLNAMIPPTDLEATLEIVK